MNPQSTYHAYAMTYLELRRARTEGAPVPTSVLARLGARRLDAQIAAMRALKDVERLRPMRAKPELLTCLQRSGLGLPA